MPNVPTTLAKRVARRFLAASQRTAGWEDAKSDIRRYYPDVEPRTAKLFDTASNLTRATHARFQNALAGIGEASAELWEELAARYGEATRMWNTLLSAGPKLGAQTEELRDKALGARKVCMEREREAKKRFREALDMERLEEDARWESRDASKIFGV